MNELLELTKLDFYSTFLSVFVILFAAKAVITIFEWIVQKLGLETKWIRSRREKDNLLFSAVNEIEKLAVDRKNDLEAIHNDNIRWREHSKKIQEKYDDRFKKLDKVQEQTEQFYENEKNRKQQIDTLTFAIKEMLAEKINEKYKYYISIKGIPEDEVDEFTSLHYAYKGCGGNHHGDAKYNYVMKNLPVIPVETKLIYEKDVG